MSIFYNVIGWNNLHFDKFYSMKIYNIVVNIRTILVSKLIQCKGVTIYRYIAASFFFADSI